MRLFGMICCLLLLSLLGWEMVVREWVVSPAVVQHDAELGAIKAGDVNILRSYEGFSRYRTDRYGMNNDALPDVWPEARWLVLGDSFVEAEQVMRSENFVSRLNREGQRLVYNAGISGADPRYFPVLLQRLLPVLKPTRLILCVNGGDLLALERLRLPHHTPPEGLKSLLQPLFAHSALMTHLNWKYKPVLQAWWEKLHTAKMVDSAGETHDVQSEIAHWQSTLATLQKQSIPMLVVVMPSIRYTSHGVLKADSEAAELMALSAQVMGVDVLRTEPAFMDDFARSHRVALGFANSELGHGHLNVVGHELLAALIHTHLAASQ